MCNLYKHFEILHTENFVAASELQHHLESGLRKDVIVRQSMPTLRRLACESERVILI